MDRNDLVRKHKELLAKARAVGEEARSLEGAEKREKQAEANRYFDELDTIAADIKLHDRADEVSNRFGEPEERRVTVKERSKDVSRDIPTPQEVVDRSRLIQRMRRHGADSLTSDERRDAHRQFPGEEVFWRKMMFGESELSADERGLYRDWLATEARSWQLRAAPGAPWNVANDTQGGDLVPEMWEARIHDEAAVVGPMMRPDLAHRVDTMTGGKIYLTVDKNAKDQKFTIATENADTAPTRWDLGQEELDSYKYARAATFSYELVRDAIVDFPAYVSRIFGLALGRGVNEHLTAGTGVGQPQGFSIATKGTTVAGGQKAAYDALSANDLIELQFGVNSIYRQRGVYQMRDDLLKAARLLKDNQQQFLWQPQYRAGQPPTIAGKPYIENPDVFRPTGNVMASMRQGVSFGDYQAGYAVRHVGRMRMKRNDSTYVLADQIVLVAFDEWDGQVMIDAAIANLNTSA